MSMESSSIQISRIVFDVLILACFVIPCLILEIYGKPHKSGFYCDDASIRYPFHKPTVSTELLNFLALSIPIVLVSQHSLGQVKLP
ncbi:hypothetical protein OESDEN_04334 [Oesophagostomum dentatum]|uniref:Phosphatidic acid phosphatase type 2/haloperoxidase domain-containing protein n=1 Tax=Oesophagostomum dentatum TaxID=61180 RepID=A0A0B1TI10_OESDE|nr:hypothetical protein OESDEN_04334 [Oesophagostomum dentatum]